MHEKLHVTVKFSHYLSNFGHGDISKVPYSQCNLRLNNPLEGRGVLENIFPGKQITCIFPKGRRVWPNKVGSDMSLLSLCSKRNSNKLYFFTIDIDVVFFLIRRYTQDLIDIPDQLKRDLLYIQPLAFHASSKKRLFMIYVGLVWMSWWLVYLILFFESKESMCRFFTGFYSWFALFKNSGNLWEKKGENH